jgi:uncharacterized protein
VTTLWYMQVENTPDSAWLKPSARLWRMRVAEVAVAGPVLAAGAGIGVGIGAGPAAGIIAALVLLPCAGLVLLFLRNRFRTWAYCERADDLLVARGVLVSRLSVVPYGRMQFVEVTAGVAERMFGLSTVKLHTAAAASDARIPGLERAEATRLRDRLAMLGEAKAAGL